MEESFHPPPNSYPLSSLPFLQSFCNIKIMLPHVVRSPWLDVSINSLFAALSQLSNYLTVVFDTLNFENKFAHAYISGRKKTILMIESTHHNDSNFVICLTLSNFGLNFLCSYHPCYLETYEVRIRLRGYAKFF